MKNVDKQFDIKQHKITHFLPVSPTPKYCDFPSILQDFLPSPIFILLQPQYSLFFLNASVKNAAKHIFLKQSQRIE
jgi:hypothetical protein